MIKLRLPIKPTVLTVFMALTVSVVLVVSGTNYWQGTSAARETALDFITHAENTTRENTEKLLGTARLLGSSIANIPLTSGTIRDSSSLAEFLYQSMREVPQVYSAYLAFGDGRFIQTINLIGFDGEQRPLPGVPKDASFASRVIDTQRLSGERFQVWHYYGADGNEIAGSSRTSRSGYDPRQRAWFHRALETGRLGASAIYIFSSSRKPGLTISMPMRNLRNAVVGLDIPLEGLARFVDRQRPGANGLIAIVDSNETMVAHPDSSMIVARSRDGSELNTVKLQHVADSLLQSVVEPLAADATGQTEVIFRNQSYFVSSLPIDAFPGEQWKVISIAALRDFTGAVKKSTEISALIAMIMLILSVGLVVVIANWIANPLIESSSFAERISELDLESDAPRSSPLYEVQKLSSSMAAMRNALGMFLSYAPRDLVRDLVLSGKSAEIGGTRQDVTIMFTDIEGFTAMTEKQSPEEVLEQTSAYFQAVTEALEPYDTTIDKFIGDAIMAMWNAPLEDPEHIDHACFGMLAAHKASEDLNATLGEKGLPTMRTRFGLHTGLALVGNVGAKERMQFTSLGPVVNLASRIEGLNKYYGTQLLVSDAVAAKASGTFVFRKVDIVSAAGTSIPVTLYELLGVDDVASPFAVSPDQLRFKKEYETGFDLFADRAFADAQAVFEKLHDAMPDDISVSQMLDRCTQAQAEKPGADWSAVRVFDKK